MIQKIKGGLCACEKIDKKAHEEIETSEVTKKLFTRLAIISAMMGIKRKD
nr:MAG TPA: hypothetical protein [Caudoviricetes sp.]